MEILTMHYETIRKKLYSPVSDSFHENMIKRLPRLILFPILHCSHSCYYCAAQNSLSNKEFKKNLLLDKIGPETYLKCILRILKKMTQVSFAGCGEFPEHATFPYLVKGVLDAGHHVSLLTNGTTSNIIEKTFAAYPESMIRERVEIGLSFHYGVYLKDQSRKRLDAYINEHFPRLASLGAAIELIVPLTPQVLGNPDFFSHITHFKEICKAKNVPFKFSPYPFYSKVDNQYPKNYTDEDLTKVIRIMNEYQDVYF